ncbi:MAG: permease [Phycisphaerae bacterium]
MSDANAQSQGQSGAGYRRLVHLVGFPLAMALIYGVIAMLNPERALAALRASGRVLLQVAPALAMAFVVMVLMNLLVTPARIQRFLGEGTKLKGGLLSSVAGILSMGSIYAWYPLLKNLREKGVTDFHLANFLGCRAVKLPLLPLMAAYFGWTFTLILSALMVLDALLTGLAVSQFGPPGIEA